MTKQKFFALSIPNSGKWIVFTASASGATTNTLTLTSKEVNWTGANGVGQFRKQSADFPKIAKTTTAIVSSSPAEGKFHFYVTFHVNELEAI